MKAIVFGFTWSVLFILPFLGFSQTRTITGEVLAFNRYPLNNVTVMAKKAKSEVKTNENGEFKIDVKNKDMIQIKESVFMEHNEKISEKTKSLRVNLIFVDKGDNVEKAVSFGFIDKEDLEYGIENFFRDNSVYGNFGDAYQAIKYALPESTIIYEDGRKAIQFRGPKTIRGSNAALILVDGVIVEDISFINPVQIISISKLNTNAAALYGARAANGVINITTK